MVKRLVGRLSLYLIDGDPMFEYIDFEKIEGTNNKGDIKLFGLSTCAFCKRAISFLEDNSIKYDLVFMDTIDSNLKMRAKEEFKAKFNERMSLPALVINEDDYQIGFIRIAWERLFPPKINEADTSENSFEFIESEVTKFVDATAKYKKWFINPDKKFRQKLEEGLSVNYKRYGFYHCPCRDSDGVAENKDIACPCIYAENDIKEWGQCFCGLYVSGEFYNNRIELGSIPERRKET
jgi:ferredoxin-thioredoxin reductase catalytic subunit/glutaredoxin